jgi:hypothetical protein
MNGPVTVRRARFRCSVDGTFHYPLDELLDLPPNEVTVSLARRSLRLCTHMGFSDVQEELYYQHEVRLSDTVLNRVMQQAGGMAEQDRKSASDGLCALSMGVAREEYASSLPPIVRPKRLYISCDGVMYPTRYRQTEGGRKRLVYQEMKCGTVFWQEGKIWRKRVISSRDDVAGFGASLWVLAVRCGMLQADEVVFISDGGGWCDTVARTYFADAERILDWYHLVEHVWEAARALYRDEQATKKWATRCTSLLRESSGIGLMRYLDRCRQGHASKPNGSAGLEALDGLIGYLRPRVPITDYVDYRERGMIIGSGIMESTCKQLVGRRLKGSGRQWSEAGAVAMAALIGHRLNGTWEEFWSSRPIHRAA